MKFYDIEDDTKVYPGEYLLHIPSQQIILCGAYKKNDGIIKGLSQGSLMEDKVENFKKIRLTVKENKDRKATRCKGCGG
jgi:hypothetical protein